MNRIVRITSIMASIILILCFPLIMKLCLLNPDDRKANTSDISRLPAFKLWGSQIKTDTGLSYFESLDRFYSSVSGYQQLLEPIYYWIKNSILHVSPYPEKVVKGKDGWLFLGDYYSNVILESKGLLNFSSQELFQIRDKLRNTLRFFQERNIQFYLVIVPDKSSIYGNYLPIIKTNKPTKLTQINSLLNKNGYSFINLEKEFYTLHRQNLYLKTDSHWNQLGLFLGYTAIMKTILVDFPEMVPLQINQLQIDTTTTKRGDLARMMNLNVRERVLILTPNQQSQAESVQKKYTPPVGYTLNPSLYERRWINHERKNKLLVFHDSFFSQMQKFFKENFNETIFIWSNIDFNLIELEKPDLVIYELAEREIDVLMNLEMH